jgi:hypothetical protein
VLLFVLKVVLAPLLVVGATLAGRRWGATVAGMVTALPIVAGPILAVIALEHGRTFGAAAARSALLGMVALCAYCAAFARGAGAGWPWPRALAGGWLAFLAFALPLSRVDVAPGWGLAIVLAALAITYVLIGDPGPADRREHPPPAWDLAARAGSTAALVIGLTSAAGALGPAPSGVLTPFPVATSVISAFTLQLDGAAAARAMLRGFIRGLPGFAAFFCAVAIVL